MENWQKDMVTFFLNRWDDHEDCVVLYLTSGHKIKGAIDFSFLETFVPGQPQEKTRIPLTAEDRSETIELGTIYLRTKEGDFRTHASKVAGYTLVDGTE